MQHEAQASPALGSGIADFPKFRCWAVVGVSADPSKYGNKIFRDLRDAGYTVYAVNPKLSEVEGAPCYPNLAALPQTPDVVDVVVPPAVSEHVVAECLGLGIPRIWFQPGSESEAALQQAHAGGMEVVHDACIMIQKQAWAD